MAALKQYHIHDADNQECGYVLRSLINGEWVEVARKEPPPPLGTVSASDITAALAEARRWFGHRVVVSRMGPVETVTTHSAVAQRAS